MAQRWTPASLHTVTLNTLTEVHTMTLEKAGRRALLMLIVAPALAGAQEADPVQRTTPCTAEQYRQFDFWIGSWEVTTPEGNVAGENTIDSILGGCALRERWRGTRGMNGTSTNTYDPHRDLWHQTWVDDRGGFLLLSGGIRDGSMVLSGEMVDERGPILHRITWTPMDGGEVRQLWETSRDGGATWEIVFDGRYSRRGAEGAAND